VGSRKEVTISRGGQADSTISAISRIGHLKSSVSAFSVRQLAGRNAAPDIPVVGAIALSAIVIAHGVVPVQHRRIVAAPTAVMMVFACAFCLVVDAYHVVDATRLVARLPLG
jgi:hypothetical protein